MNEQFLKNYRAANTGVNIKPAVLVQIEGAGEAILIQSIQKPGERIKIDLPTPSTPTQN